MTCGPYGKVKSACVTFGVNARHIFPWQLLIQRSVPSVVAVGRPVVVRQGEERLAVPGKDRLIVHIFHHT